MRENGPWNGQVVVTKKSGIALLFCCCLGDGHIFVRLRVTWLDIVCLVRQC